MLKKEEDKNIYSCANVVADKQQRMKGTDPSKVIWEKQQEKPAVSLDGSKNKMGEWLLCAQR